MIGLALFATNISCMHLVSLAQSGFDTGLLNGNFEWMTAFVLILLALLFIPFYIRSGVSTLPEFPERRYNKSCRDWLALISIISAIIIHIAFSFLAGGTKGLTVSSCTTEYLLIMPAIGEYRHDSY